MEIDRPLPVTEEHLKAIGLVVVESSITELYLQLTYCMIHNLNEEKRREEVTRWQPTRLLKQIREGADAMLDKQDSESLLKILEPFGEIISERHDVIHGIWITSDDKRPGRVGVAVFRGQTRVGGRGIEKTVADLEGLVGRIRHANYELQEFLRPRGGLQYIGVSLPKTL